MHTTKEIDGEFFWNVKEDGYVLGGMYIPGIVIHLYGKDFTHFINDWPFKHGWKCEYFCNEDYFILDYTRFLHSDLKPPHVGTLKPDQVEKILAPLKGEVAELDYIKLRDASSGEFTSLKRLVIIGLVNEGWTSLDRIRVFIEAWLNEVTLPHLRKLNQIRIESEIHPALQFDLRRLMDACYVVEAQRGEELGSGTAFAISERKLLTCFHCIGDSFEVFKCSNHLTRFSGKVIDYHEHIDYAVVEVDFDLDTYLELGSADDLDQMNNICVCGFPNYSLGDTETVTPGIVSGFRTRFGVRQILTNAAIVTGMSGGPVIDASTRVIGIVTTGASSVEDCLETEKKGILPIDIIRLHSKLIG